MKNRTSTFPLWPAFAMAAFTVLVAIFIIYPQAYSAETESYAAAKETYQLLMSTQPQLENCNNIVWYKEAIEYNKTLANYQEQHSHTKFIRFFPGVNEGCDWSALPKIEIPT